MNYLPFHDIEDDSEDDGDDRREPDDEKKVQWLAGMPIITNVTIEKANWIEKAGTGIANSRSLRKIQVYIEFNDRDDNNDDWLHEVCDAISRNRSIEEFALSMIDDRSSVMDEHRPIDVDIFNVLAPFFEQNDKLRVIKIEGVTSKELNSLLSTLPKCTKKNNSIQLYMREQGLTLGGWRSFFAFLSHPDCMLESLRLCSIFLTSDDEDDEEYEAISCLGAALAVNTTLKGLCLDSINTITTAGWLGFLNRLRNSHSALESLCLCDCEIDDEVAEATIMALAEISTIKMLDMMWNDIDLSGTVVARVLCDKTSINSTFSSNHTLFDLLVVRFYPDELDAISSCLNMNRDVNKSKVAHKKILEYHFPGVEWGLKHLLLCQRQPFLMPSNGLGGIGMDIR